MIKILGDILFRSKSESRKINIPINSSSNGSCPSGYVRLSDSPEIVAGVTEIAKLISNMSIHLMENSEFGDVRIVNGLSRLVDIKPNKYQTGKPFIEWIVKTLLLNGDGNAFVMPTFKNGLLDELLPIPYSKVSINGNGYSYNITVDGLKYNPDEIIHFKINPSLDEPYKGTGVRIVLRDILTNLNQANKTKLGFMNSNWKPPIIISVDSLAGDLSTPEGRDQILEQYVSNSSAGKPWVIPADLLKIDTVKPLSLKDLAINESVEIDKKTVAAILGVPAFVLGVGEFNANEFNNFIDTTILSISKTISEELTDKLLISPNLYFKFNHRSLYSFNFKDTAEVFGALYNRGLVTGNEVRNEIGLTPDEKLNDYVILENYIPTDKVGDQTKLTGGD